MAVKIKENKKLDKTSFNFRKINGGVVLSNDFGCHCVLSEKDFEKILKGKKIPSYLEERLSEAGFISKKMDFDKLFSGWQKKNSFLYTGPGLNIFVLTLRCNHKCLYCQSGALSQNGKKSDMSWQTAKKSVDMAFSSPNPNISIEFQGGEPLANWPVLEKTVKYARKKQKDSKKNLFIALVSNLSLMDEKKAEFLLKNEISICTSLDGPSFIHNKNRPFSLGNSHSLTVKWIKYFMKRHDEQKDLSYRIFKPSALLTVSKNSLGFHKEIIDEYVSLGLESIFFRPLSPIGYAAKYWDKIGYNSKEFLSFYRKGLEYIISLNLKGKKISEKTAQMLLTKIFDFKDPGFLDLRCPCGASVGQIAYNWDGSIYTCDEGRMIGWEGDDFFKAGDINKSSYKDIINSSATKGCMVTSNLENQPMCFRCAYKPWCGVCPAVNYEAQKTPWGNIISSQRCEIFMGIFDILFELLGKKRESEVLKSWISEDK
ncbi:MAG: His-Xaa-Ser system radical SAM maturase HxsB [Elusimicrobia bacterium]|nr:His-Xaa-Ser system radical SAM maturase HxsB [Elusimicrobiota bacterium]